MNREEIRLAEKVEKTNDQFYFKRLEQTVDDTSKMIELLREEIKKEKIENERRGKIKKFPPCDAQKHKILTFFRHGTGKTRTPPPSEEYLC